ncbi:MULTISPECIES: hypothetical protein [Halorussus]|uniref:hypothetical protein n=1 Tax=Halorussus TaxID=1070314 RepID=UPI00209D500F|nr:hypothetical protein [Halorussus vallis]USZ76405.1 hypothetical protein NGM07_03535 [Halorussus vallis]
MVFGYVVYLGFLVVSGGAVLVGVGLVRDGFREWREFNALVDVPVASLDAVAVGEAAVAGTIRPRGSPTTVPVGEGYCVCYEVSVSDSTDATAVHEERDHVPCEVDDGDGSIRLDPSDFAFDLTDDRTESFAFKSYDEIPARARDFHETRDLPDRGMRRDRTVEYAYLRPGDEVYAYGRVRPDEKPTDGDEKAVVLTGGESGFLSNKSREDLRSERRYALGKAATTGVVVSTLGLGGFLWLSGFAQLFLGA